MKKVCLYTFFIFVFSLFYAQPVLMNSLAGNSSTINSPILEIDDFLADYVSRGWTASDGLPGNTITDIIQDNLGYLYIGTYEGLVRFDGLEFTIYNKNHDKRYPFVSARKIFQSSNGDLWVGSNDEGICCISQDPTIPVKAFTTKNGLPNNSIRAITEDKSGNIWVGTAGGVIYITVEGKIEFPDRASLVAFEDDNCLCTNLYCDTVGRIWLSTSKKNGIYYYLDGKFTNYAKNLNFDKDVYVTYVTQDNTDVFWFGLAPHYAVRIDEKSSKTFDLSYKPTVYDEKYTVPTSTIINCIYQDKNGTLWFATDGGFVIYRNGKFLHYSENEGLVDNNVNRLIEDREGNIWIATDRGGVQKMNKGRFKTINLPSSVNAIAEGFDHRVWLGCDNGLVCYRQENENTSLTQEKNPITEYCKNTRVRHVGIASNGDILISTYAKLGQLRFAPDGTLVAQWLKKDGLTGEKTRVAIESSITHDVYVGTTTGLNIIDTNGVINRYTREQGLPHEYIMCIYEDVSDGSIWIGTDGGGIFVMKDRKIIKTYTTDNGLVGNVIFKISKSSDGAFWICTGCGINRFYNNRFFSYTSELGLGTDSVFHMLVDDTGSAWMTSNGGISCITMSSMIGMFDGGIDHLDSRFFSRSDGLKTGGVTSTSLSMKDSKGRIWFTLIDGFAIYDPKNLSFNRTRPLVHIENISIDGKKVLWKKGDSFEVAAGTKRINIKYTGISFVSSELLRFTYKLEGFEKDFSSWQSNRTVSYTNLKPGKYVFHVFAQNGDNILSSDDATLTFTQKAFFYQRYSFWITVILTVTLLIILLVYSRINSLQKQQKLLETMVVERTAQLEAEKEKSDKLLLNILPEPVANKLKQNPDKVIADEKRNVSVLFADIVNFTKTTSNISPEELVSALNDLYSLFDMRAVREGIEKIKTIGDAYMAASGLTVEDLSHAEHLINYARGMLSDVKEYNKTATIKFNMRIGINSGSVVAGVIGKSKYIYDIWGDTVNVASRMEHTGAESRIHVSEKTWQLCNNEIAFDEEVEVEVKGKGKMRTFYTK